MAETPFKPDPNFIIPTSRLNISYLFANSPTHCNFIVKLWNTEDFIQSCGKTGLDSPEKVSRFLQDRVYASYARNGYGLFLVSLKPEADSGLGVGKLIGTVSLMKGEPPNGYALPDVGFAILPEEAGKGYATEAGKAVIEWVKTSQNLDGVFGFCNKENVRSRRVLEKVGLEFRDVRKLRVFGGEESAVFVDPGMSKDLTIYGLDD
jgi:RimJ/RimL family protein N-acetyltransferase